MRGKVVLFYPAYEGPPLSAPLCLLALAATLRARDFEVVVIDAAITPQYKNSILKEVGNAVCLGISVLTGPMIQGAIEIATAVRNESPNLPVIFGGWHPSLLPDQTLDETFVDAVATHQFSEFTDHSFGRERIESALVKHHVGAVITGIRTADTGRICELADSASSLVRIEINQIKSWGGEGFQTLNLPFGIVLLASGALAREACYGLD